MDAIVDAPAVDWTAYAARYDLLLDHNPAYRDLIDRFADWLGRTAPAGAFRALDVGAGTGSFGAALLARCTGAHLTLLEPDPGMRAVAGEKLAPFEGRFTMLDAGFADLETVRRETGGFDVVMSTHAIYTAEDPRRALRDLHEATQPGGCGFLIDFGGRMRVWDWRLYLMMRLIRKVGLRQALMIARDAREVATQNALVARMQATGRYWTHDRAGFVAETSTAGWRVERSASVYRGYSTLVEARRAL